MKITEKPLVSVIMPVHNYAEYLPYSIESILNQTYSNFEFIIVDDASIDKSYKIISSYKKEYPTKIKVVRIKNKINRAGEFPANIGMQYSKGTYIARMDADDIAFSTRLEKQVEFLEKHRDVFLVGSSAYLIDKDGKIIGEKIQPESHNEIYKAYSTFDPIINPSSMYRQSLINNKKFQYKFKDTFRLTNDYYTFFELICKGYKFANIPEKLIYRRIHSKSVTFSRIKEAFFTTLKVRLDMLLNYNYKPSLKSIFSNILQLALVLFLSEQLILKLYLLSKKITRSTPSLTYGV